MGVLINKSLAIWALYWGPDFGKSQSVVGLSAPDLCP